MAGESPDRSKQRESSAEPTSGSAGTVPESGPEADGTRAADTGEKRDPRLAVARESGAPQEPAATRRGGVDTATRVLSRRELEAVRAELEKAGGAEDGDADAGAGGGDAGSPDAEGASAEGSDAASAEGGDAGNRDAEADDTEAADAEGSDAASAEGSEAGNRDAEADDTEGAQAEGSDAGSAEGGDAGNRDAEADDTDGSDAASAEGSEAGNRDAEADDTDGSDAASAEGGDAGNRDAEADDTDSAQAEGKGAVDGTSSEVPGDGDGDGDEASGPGDDRLRAAVAAWVASSDDDADAGDEADGAEGGTDAEGAEKAEGADSAQSVADAEADETSAAAEAPGKAAADADEAAADAAPDDAPAVAKDAEDGSGDAARTPADAAPDGEDAPQGPPAPGDESRTGGAGGKAKADGEAEAGPAVDQPTAVFKAVRPPKPSVDQPTTTLKAPKQPETPAERTSKFVALKPDLPRDTPKAPAPDATAAIPQVGPERTTQQPLPPRPPLDLLAELTNTPPPPETPFRTLIRRIKIWTPLVLLLVVILGVVQSVRPLPAPALDLTAEESYTFDGGKVDIPWPAEGQAALDVDGLGTFGSSGDQKPVPIASVAKVMTAYLILREHPLKSGAEGPDIEIDQTAEDQSDAGQESTVDVTAGDKISQREALESVLIASANNIARRLARWDAGSEKAFVAKMNAAAKDLGMTNTTYTDPSGLNNTTVSTAVDQVRLAKAAMKQPAFREVAAMMSYDDYKGKNHPNWNQLVGHNNVVGIKTGTTTSALGNLVFAAKKEAGGETRTIIGAVVRQPDAGGGILAAALDSGDQLIRAAQDALKSATLLKKGDVVGYVDDGLGGRTPVVATKDVTAVGWSGLKVELTFASDAVPHTAKAGTKVGTLTVGDGTSGAVKIPVALQRDLTEPGFTDKLTRLG
ncbi:D-alanyl-D-alanine carboxypeptidase [Streptomyces sp. DT2A-34]|uniref:D-alanyl-D-alanine carboxypeptidase n=1 Tax=Streptomyces sp. DT2A-34 TaxID=3051182 RepID=UPI00265BE235|nr:D-alanyl-D-alanine carboxypeptidase [Streptomyces sp. DT2A-34]MDO0914101.1 D-alanyl-D-alanine carboxypeptidase [Streptomyces sp. DT2A-34]